MRRECPKAYQQRITEAGGLNRYGEPNFKLAWSKSETMRSGGVWTDDHYFGYRHIYLANSSTAPPHKGYWMLMEWDAPETFGGNTMWGYLHRDEATGLAVLGSYPFRGRYKIALKLTWNIINAGKMTITPRPLNSSVINTVLPLIKRAKKMKPQARKAFMMAERLQADQKRKSAIESVVREAKSDSKLLMPSVIDDRARLLEKGWDKWIKEGRSIKPGFQQQKSKEK